MYANRFLPNDIHINLFNGSYEVRECFIVMSIHFEVPVQAGGHPAQDIQPSLFDSPMPTRQPIGSLRADQLRCLWLLRAFEGSLQRCDPFGKIHGIFLTGFIFLFHVGVELSKGILADQFVKVVAVRVTVEAQEGFIHQRGCVGRVAPIALMAASRVNPPWNTDNRLSRVRSCSVSSAQE